VTPKQSQVLKFINNFWSDKSYAPSYDEIQKGLKINSQTSVAQICNSLVKRGYIERIKYAHRSMKPTDEGKLHQ